ncbi:DUF411 domain-containing protein [Methyloceanibacter sp.]|uniref:DUF411 domain-containing protein n=1 Tax=Methyloceanibacter sp. TaxID=1965321 RepID=UPI0020809A3B|nr:DUF411 domain-containing protein [Methyloceanibacter sp.]GFO83378.1 MAG: periplasmic protein [Methyloceanibacter sp.]HML93642.1 DUF411 domain-containing protein [Methyloceanibacter sp.]
MLTRRLLILSAALVLPGFAMHGPARATADTAPAIEVWKSPTCDCCQKWADYLTDNGFTVAAKNTSYAMMDRIKRQAGIGKSLESCHTGLIGGYAIEGHVPAEDIKRLLKERPDAAGLAVPKMPIGSPGMEQPDGTTEPYDVLLVKKDGSTEIFASH